MFNINNKSKKIIVAIVAISVLATACKISRATPCSTCESKN